MVDKKPDSVNDIKLMLVLLTRLRHSSMSAQKKQKSDCCKSGLNWGSRNHTVSFAITCLNPACYIGRLIWTHFPTELRANTKWTFSNFCQSSPKIMRILSSFTNPLVLQNTLEEILFSILFSMLLQRFWAPKSTQSVMKVVHIACALSFKSFKDIR